MSIKFLVLGGAGYFGFFWGGSADFIFMGARIFLIKRLGHPWPGGSSVQTFRVKTLVSLLDRSLKRTSTSVRTSMTQRRMFMNARGVQQTLVRGTRVDSSFPQARCFIGSILDLRTFCDFSS